MKRRNYENDMGKNLKLIIIATATIKKLITI